MAANQKRAAGLLFALALLASSAGLFVSAQSAQEVGTWATTGAIADGRNGAVSVTLGDGTTLIAGGVTNGTPTSTVLRYDPATNSLVGAGQLLSARVGHSATALADGRVLVIGGEVDAAPSSDIELFDPASGGSTLIGQLSAPRTRHAAARVSDDVVLVVGGANADGVVLDTVERVNVSTGAVSAGPNRMLRARAGASATTIIDGRVLVAGGSNGSADLRSAELYIPWSESFELTVNQLSVPRSGHTAVLLPHNGGVLIAGGNSSGTAQASVDLLVPVESPDPFSYGPNAFVATAAMAGARAGAAAGPGREGFSWVDGGGAANAETYRFATIKTDKDDYAPGQRAVITGSGWLPNSEVRLVFQEDPAVHADYVLTVPSDAAGNIYWDEWAPEEHDLNVRFYLIASDSRSRAQMTFTDRNPQSISVGTQSPDPVTAGTSATYTVSVLFAGNTNACTVTLNVAGLPTGASFSFSPNNQPSASTPNGELTVTRTLTITTTGSGPNTTPATPPNHVFTVTGTNGVGCQGPGPTAGTGTLRVASANSAPTVAFATGDTVVDESGVTQHVYTYSINDPNAGDTVSSVTTSCGTNGVKVTGSDTNDNDDGSFACTFPDGPASSTVTVQATDNGGAASNTATRTVTIANVAPTVTVNGDATANEGDTKVYTYTVTDPGDDPSPAITESCGANGTRTDTATVNHFECTFSDGPASSTVSITANDGDASNNIGTGSVVVTIANVGPTVTFTAGPTTVNESGVAEHSFSYTISDPGADTVTAVNTTCGANGTKVSGSDTNTNTSGSFRCRFPDGPATSTVTAQATDSDGATGANGERAVTVDNVAPTVAFTAGSTSVDESNVTEHTYTYSITDPGDDTVGAVNTTCGANGTKVVGSDTNSNTSGSFRCRFPDGPATSTVTAQATDSDGGTGANGERAVTVVNVAPTVAFTVAPTPVDESNVAEYTYSYSINDPGDDTVSAVTTTCGANGTKVSGSDTTTNTSGSFRCRFPDGPATSTVTAQATDSDGATGLNAERVITVNNVAPAVEFTAGPASVDESSVTEHTYTYAITDPGNDTITAVNTTCGANGTKVAGSDTNTDTSGSFKCKFPDGPATSTVTAQATDSDGATGGNGERVVTVNNVGPTVTFTVAPASVNESSVTEYTYSYSITDPGDDTIQSVSTSCGTTGVKVTGSDANTNTSGSFRCRFDDGPASSTVTAQATDSDGTSGNTDSRSVTILNVAPTAAVANNGPVGEGSPATIAFTGQSDPSSADTSAGFKYSFSCVNNPAALATSWTTAGMSSSGACTFGDNGSYTVLARILDKNDGYTDYTTVVTVTNVSPVLNSPTFTLNPFTGAATAGISFSDTGWLDLVSSSFNWPGTGTPPSFGPGASPALVGTFGSSHTFPVGCVTGAISVSVTDDDGGVTSHVLAAAGTLDVYSVGFMAPLRDGARNVVKLGNVIPVKLSIRDCNGAPVTGKTLSIWVAAGIIDYEDVENGAELLTTTSVSSADTNGFMRYVDSHYMYNLATKNLAINLPYTIVIKEGNLVVATAVIEPKK